MEVTAPLGTSHFCYRGREPLEDSAGWDGGVGLGGLQDLGKGGAGWGLRGRRILELLSSGLGPPPLVLGIAQEPAAGTLPPASGKDPGSRPSPLPPQHTHTESRGGGSALPLSSRSKWGCGPQRPLFLAGWLREKC